MTTVRNEPLDRNEPRHDAAAPVQPRKPFVEPAISSPVDVLEATTFFQAVESGSTGVRKPSND